MHDYIFEYTDLKSHYDVVVIGSGYGGSVAALRMAQAGYDVCVLERGKAFPAANFPDSPYTAIKELRLHAPFWKSKKQQALIDLYYGKDINVIVANGLGGGSLINAAVALRPDNTVFSDESWPEEIRAEGSLDDAFHVAEGMLETRIFSKRASLKKYQALERNGRALDAEISPLPMAISFEKRKNKAGVALNKCTGCGDCWIGCKNDAKNSLDKNYLPAAAELGTEIFTGCDVDYLEQTDQGEWKIHYTRVGEKNAKHIKSYILASKVVLGAGALGSTEILLRSKEKGLEISERLGQGFSGNGDFMAYSYDNDHKVNGIATGLKQANQVEQPVGPAATAMLKVKNIGKDKHNFIIQDGTLLSILTGTTVSMNLLNGYLKHALVNFWKGAYKGYFSTLQTYLVVSQDNAQGKMSLKKDKLQIEWKNLNDQPAYRDIDEMLETASKADGGRYFTNPITDNFFIGRRPITVHPMGGCGMGESSETGVVNHKAQVFKADEAEKNTVYQGLYVCDGAIMPRSLGINPLLTITALAEYAMAQIEPKNQSATQAHEEQNAFYKSEELI